MNTIKTYLITLLCLAPVASWAQSSKEKEVNDLLLVADSLQKKHEYLQARTMAGQILRLAESSPPYRRGIADAYMLIGLAYKGEGENEAALENYRKALRIREDVLKDRIGVARTYGSMSSALLEIGNVEEALNNAKKAEAIYLAMRSLETDSLRARLYSGMANVLEALDSLDKAIEINRNGLALSSIAKDTATMAKGEYGLALRLVELERYDSAIFHLKTALGLNQTMRPPDSIFLGQIYEALGVIEMRKRPSNLDSVIFYLKLAEAVTLRFTDAKGRLSNIYFNLAEAYENKDELDQAASAYQQALEYYPDATNEPNFSELLKTRISGIEFDKERRKVGKWLYMALVGLILALIIILFFIYSNYRKEKSNAVTNKLLLTTAEKNKALEDEMRMLRHDIVKNYLHIINRLIVENTIENTAKTFDQIKHEINELLVLLGYPNASKNITPTTLKALAKAMHVKAQITSGIAVVNGTLFEDLPDLPVSEKLVSELMLIVVEAFTNIRKYAFDVNTPYKTASISLEYHYEDGLTLVIEDKGKGFDYETANKSGLNSIETRANTINGKLTIHSEIGKGTTIKLRFPGVLNL